MKKRNLFMCVMTGILVVALLGCGNSNSTEKETEKETEKATITFGSVLEQIHETEVTSGAFDLSATNKYKMKDGKNSIRNGRMYADIQYAWSQNPTKIYMKEDYEVIKFENNTNDKTVEKLVDTQSEQYIIEMKYGAIVYLKGADNKWYYSNATLTTTMENVYMDDFFLDYSMLTEEQSQIICEDDNIKIDGRDTYQFIVKGTYSQTGELLKWIMEHMLLNIEGISMDVEWTFRFYVDKETYEPVSCIVELQEPLDFSDSEKTVWSDNCKIHITYSKINKETTVILPDSVRQNAIKMAGDTLE